MKSNYKKEDISRTVVQTMQRSSKGEALDTNTSERNDMIDKEEIKIEPGYSVIDGHNIEERLECEPTPIRQTEGSQDNKSSDRRTQGQGQSYMHTEVV